MKKIFCVYVNEHREIKVNGIGEIKPFVFA